LSLTSHVVGEPVMRIVRVLSAVSIPAEKGAQRFAPRSVVT